MQGRGRARVESQIILVTDSYSVPRVSSFLKTLPGCRVSRHNVKLTFSNQSESHG